MNKTKRISVALEPSVCQWLEEQATMKKTSRDKLAAKIIANCQITSDSIKATSILPHCIHILNLLNEMEYTDSTDMCEDIRKEVATIYGYFN